MAVLEATPAGAAQAIRLPSLSASGDSEVVKNWLIVLEKGRHRPSASTETQLVSSLPNRLFNASSVLKVAVSQVSMHLSDEWRRWLFRKIDQLHETEDWEETDATITRDSFMNFLRLVLQVGPLGRFSLGVSEGGNLLTGWVRDKDTLSIEFAGPEEVRWSVVRFIGGQREIAAGRNSRGRLLQVLAPYSPEIWFENAVNLSA